MPKRSHIGSGGTLKTIKSKMEFIKFSSDYEKTFLSVFHRINGYANLV